MLSLRTNKIVFILIVGLAVTVVLVILMATLWQNYQMSNLQITQTQVALRQTEISINSTETSLEQNSSIPLSGTEQSTPQTISNSMEPITITSTDLPQSPTLNLTPTSTNTPSMTPTWTLTSTPSPTKTPTLTPTPLPPPMFADNFDDGLDPAWAQIDVEYFWLVSNGKAVPQGTCRYFDYSAIYVGASYWDNYKLEMDVTLDGPSEEQGLYIIFGFDPTQISFSYIYIEGDALLHLSPDESNWWWSGMPVAGSNINIFTRNPSVHLGFDVTGSSLRFYLDGELVQNMGFAGTIKGSVALVGCIDSTFGGIGSSSQQASFLVDNLTISPLNTGTEN